MPDLNGRNRIPTWVWVLLAVVVAAFIFWVVTMPLTPEPADPVANEMLVDDPFNVGEPVEPVQPVEPVEPADPVEPVEPTENAIENAQ